MKDGLVLFYMKNGTLYPVLMSKEQLKVFEIVQKLLPQPIQVLDKPQGKVENIGGIK